MLASKCFFPLTKGPNRSGLSRKHILAACDAPLKRLGHDYIDLYQIHRLDHQTPMEEILEALDSLVCSGKVRYLGASSMAAWEFATMLFLADVNGYHRFATMQNHLNLVYREEEREMIPLCLDQGVGLIPWSPLARGFLAGNRRREGKAETAGGKDDPFAEDMYYRDEDFDVVDAVIDVAKEIGKKPAQVALAWTLSVPGVDAPIVGSTKIEQLEELVEAVAIELDDDLIERLEKPYRPHTVLGHKQRAPREL